MTALLVPPEGQPRGKWRRRRDTSGQGVSRIRRPIYSFPGICSCDFDTFFPQSGVDPSLAERLLEEASSRAEDLRDENVRLRELLIGHLQTLWTLSDNGSNPAGAQICGDEG